MALRPEEAQVKHLLEVKNFTVTKVLEDPDKETSDFLAEYGRDKYLIEVKRREEDPSYFAEIEAKGFADQATRLGYINRLSGIIGKALKQLNTHESARESFKLIWFCLYKMENEEAAFIQLKSTLYGIKHILQLSTSEFTDCFYFVNSEFYRYRELDAVIIEMSDGLVLCVNNYSHGFENFQNSQLYKIFEKVNALIVPSRLESSGCYVADCDIDRSLEGDVLEYIKNKYNLTNVLALDFTRYRASVKVKRSSEDENDQ